MKYPYLDSQIDEIHRITTEYCQGNYKAQGKIFPLRDDIDSITTGINILGEELANTTTSLSYFNSIFNAVNDMIFVLAMNGKIKEVNIAVKQKLGLASGNIVDKYFRSIIGKENRLEFLSNLKSQLNKNSVHFLETTISVINGKKIPVLLTTSQILNRKGKQEAYLIVAQDITLRKKAEQQLLQNLILGQEKERKRISSSLHDSLGQELSALKACLLEIKRKYSKKDNFSKKVFPETISIVENISNQVKTLSFDLMPSIFESQGLRGAIRTLLWYSRYSNFNFYLSCPKILQSGKELQINIYRLIQEFLNNSLKHSKASNFYIKIYEKDERLIIKLKDDGRGFKIKAKLYSGNGLNNIETRVKAFNGKHQFASGPGKGTQLIAEFSII